MADSDEATATVQIDTNGRLYLPKAARKQLGIVNESAIIELDARVRKQLGDDE